MNENEVPEIILGDEIDGGIPVGRKRGNTFMMIKRRQRLATGKSPAPKPQGFCPTSEHYSPTGNRAEDLLDWLREIYGLAQGTEPLEEVQKVFWNFLKNNWDLACDPGKARMIFYYLKNYIIPDPDYAEVPFSEKL